MVISGHGKKGWGSILLWMDYTWYKTLHHIVANRIAKRIQLVQKCNQNTRLVMRVVLNVALEAHLNASRPEAQIFSTKCFLFKTMRCMATAPRVFFSQKCLFTTPRCRVYSNNNSNNKQWRACGLLPPAAQRRV